MGVSKASVVGGYKFGKMSIYIIQVLILAVIRCDGIRLAFRNLHLKAIQPQKDSTQFQTFLSFQLLSYVGTFTKKKKKKNACTKKQSS